MCVRVRVRYAYTLDEIGLEKGVVVDVLERNLDGWWLVR